MSLGKTESIFTARPPTPPHSEHSSGASTTSDDSDTQIPLPKVVAEPTEVLALDAATPDAHVPRDPRLIRLTGVHPFNVEAPLSNLYDEGFLTPNNLFYVRNHGAVPEVLDDEISGWTVSFEGMVENPMTFTFKQLVEDFEQITLPVTLVCAGNRRKEQNIVRKSNGFSWGPAGVSTALFTGPLMSEVLKAVKPSRKAKYMWMEGADDLPNGKYGTSIKLSWVNHNERGIMLAHKMNGVPLPPDHGRPIRVVIPGQIGGRSVKWLKRIIISDQPSDNWYHKFDNRVLPTMVSPEMAKADPSWWQDERYAIYDLSVNSAIAYPSHDELLRLSPSSQSYRIRGYAYTGGMRRITRVELSLDQGRTWDLANIDYPEDIYRDTEKEVFGGRIDMSGKDACYCWCMWNLPVSVERLAKAQDIVVRAMDDSMTIQPRDMYWNVLGMMQNSWFRVVVKNEGGTLRFEHPTQPALQPGGWMERTKKAGGDLLNGAWGEKVEGQETLQQPKIVEDIKMTSNEKMREISFEELKQHETAHEPWFVVNGEVYDGTPFLKEHPGGAQSIISAAGLDSTDEFMGIHSENAKRMMPTYHIGPLTESAKRALSHHPVESSSTNSANFLDPRVWKTSKLVSKRIVSWDTRIFTFELDHPDQTLGLPVGQHLMLRITDPRTKEVIVRSYTPISRGEEKGSLDLLVKVYFGTNSSDGGKMTTALDGLDLGHSVSFKGPIGKFEYLAPGKASISGTERTVRSFVMVCAGSGVTPIFQVLREVMQNPDDTTRCIVLDGNRLEEDILCREELDRFAEDSEERMKLVYTLTKPGDNWSGRRGRVDKSLISSEVVAEMDGGERPVCLVCGPPAMEKAVGGALKELGWTDDEIVVF